MNLVQNSQNPQAMFNNLMLSNKDIQDAMNTIKQYGGDGQKAFYEAAKQKGLDPYAASKQAQEIFNNLKGGIKNERRYDSF